MLLAMAWWGLIMKLMLMLLSPIMVRQILPLFCFFVHICTCSTHHITHTHTRPLITLLHSSCSKKDIFEKINCFV